MSGRYKNHPLYPQVLYFHSEDDDINIPVDGDSDAKGNYVLMKVWNPSTLSWERMVQPVVNWSGDLTVSMGDVENLLAKSYWKDTRYDYASATDMYIGKATTHKAATNAGNLWYIWKYTFNASGQVTRIEGPLNDDWDDRAALAWA